MQLKRQATYQDVVGLDVPVDEAHLVDAVDGTNQFRDVEPGGEASYSSNKIHFIKRKREKEDVTVRSDVSKFNSLGKFFLEDAKLDEKRHQVTTRYVIHHKVEVVPVLNVEICRKC